MISEEGAREKSSGSSLGLGVVLASRWVSTGSGSDRVRSVGGERHSKTKISIWINAPVNHHPNPLPMGEGDKNLPPVATLGDPVATAPGTDLPFARH